MVDFRKYQGVKTSMKKNRIRLSIRRLAKQKEREVLNEINDNDDKVTLGDIIKEQLR